MNYILAIMLQLSPPRNRLQIWGRQHSASALETDGGSSTTDSPDVITISVVPSIVKL